MKYRKGSFHEEAVNAAAKQTVLVNRYTNALPDPNEPMPRPVRQGGRIIANTPAGCWGPMITPELKGCLEVTKMLTPDNSIRGPAVVPACRDPAGVINGRSMPQQLKNTDMQTFLTHYH